MRLMSGRQLTHREAFLVRLFSRLLIMAFAGLTTLAIGSWLVYSNPRGLGAALMFGAGLAGSLWFARRVKGLHTY